MCEESGSRYLDHGQTFAFPELGSYLHDNSCVICKGTTSCHEPHASTLN